MCAFGLSVSVAPLRIKVRHGLAGPTPKAYHTEKSKNNQWPAFLQGRAPEAQNAGKSEEWDFLRSGNGIG